MTGTTDPYAPAPVPAFGAGLRADAAALARHAEAGEHLLAALPPKPERDEEQQRRAQHLLTAGRTCRDRFITAHAEEVYDRLTHGRTRCLRLSELAFAAADAFPGLAPTRDRLDRERAHLQAHKDGHEIDQGILFRGLLRSPGAGRHLTDAMLLPTPRALALLAGFRATGRADLGAVRIERRGPAAHLTLCNTHCLNAEDDRLVDDLETAVDLALLDDDVRVGVLRGAEMTHPRHRGRRVFSAGINLVDLHEGRISLVGFLLRRELGCIGKLVRGLLPDAAGGPLPAGPAVQKPWVAAVDAFAIGGGMQLLLVADRVVAASDAYFSLPAAQEGIVPGVANLRLTRFTGARPARRIILGGSRVRATDPEALLLCDEVVPPAAVGEAVEEAVRLLDNPAVAANRAMLNLAEEPPGVFRAYLAEFAFVQAHRLYAPDVLAKAAARRSARTGTGRR
ncbi:(3,5-dihydroxyphenyl)acetyl-CoA 1,2-dioxygenase DpgC [Streptomyces sp. NPDC049577]|uniref:(3,5-dihydroxyphenyl)acetyl-CoA 1,2-dioxygenase DpgC n=1 Tax=Streptomyces sp. NPDC049577 TaxID=3155153 RepID=UPI0034215EEE